MSEPSVNDFFFLGETFYVANNLIPNIQHTEGLPSTDSVSLISRLLQDILRTDETVILEKANVTLGASKTGSTNKEYAEKILSTYKSYDSLMLDIQRVEARIMKTHADQIIKEDAICKDFSLKERLRLRRDQIFNNLRVADVKKYALLQAEDLLPEAYERSMDFRLVQTESLNFLPSSRSMMQISKPIKKCTSLINKIISTSNKKKIKLHENKEILEANPDFLVFLNCKKGKTYEKTVMLKNVSSNIARFNLSHFPKGSNFLVRWTPLPGGKKFIAPGMAIFLTVQYQVDCYQEFSTEFKINVSDGNPVSIKIKVHRTPPILNFALYLSAGKLTEREIVKRCTVECGVCFLGECVTTTVSLQNLGGNGRFWICGEESWCFATVNNVTPDNVLPLPPFTVSPFYFSLETEENVDLTFMFSPQEFGAAIEQLHVLCDNCTVRSVELIGDGIIYTSQVVEFIDMRKTFEIDRDDDENCDSWLDLGVTVSNGLVFKCFSVRNRTAKKLTYRWDKRDVQYNMMIKEDLFQLPKDFYEILPATGEILPKDTVTFQVKCQMQNAHAGKYRHAMNFVLLDIPKEAITAESGLVVYDGPENNGVLNMITGQVELWVSVLDICAILAPTVISITGDKLIIGKEPIKRLITVTNKSVVEINVAFTIPESDPEIIRVDINPKNFALSVDASLSCTVVIHALEPKSFRKELSCIINDGDLVLNTVITGDVWHPIVSSNTRELDFGIVQRGSIAYREFKIKNKSILPLLWSIKEYAYDINDRELYIKDAQLSEEFGWLPFEGNRQPIKYYLDTEIPGVYCFLLEIRTFFDEQFIPCDYILVTATVITPKLAIRAPISNSAVFTICKRLFVGQTRRFTISLMNLTNAKSTFHWDTPTGSDIRKLDVAFSPYMGHVEGGAERAIRVTIKPQETGDVSEFYVPCYVEKESQPVIFSVVGKVDCLNVTFHMPKNPYQECFTPIDLLNCAPISWGVRGRDINYPWIAKPPKPDLESGMIVPFPSVISGHLDETSFDGEYMTVKELMEPTIPEKLDSEENFMEDMLGTAQKEDEIMEELPDDDETIAPSDNVLEDIVVEPEPPKIVHPCICHGDMENLERAPNDMDIADSTCIEREKVESKMQKVIELVPRDVILSVAPRVLQVLDIDEVPVPEPIPPSEESLLGFPPTPPDSILDWLESKAVIEIDLPVCTSASRMFVLRNETPLLTEMQVTVSNFAGLEDDDDDTDTVMEIARRLAGVQADKWSARVNKEKGLFCLLPTCPGYYTIAVDFLTPTPNLIKNKLSKRMPPGLAVFVQPSRAKVPGKSVIPITVWVYADVWGFYSEKITCDVKGLPAFEIQLNVRVSGNPIIFPAAPKDTDPIIRFGTVLYDSGPVQRRLRAINTSSVDVRVVWHFFLTDVNNEKVKEWKPFAVKFNAWLLKESSVNSMEISKKDSNELEPLMDLIPCYGQLETKLFQMVPSEVVIPAKSEISFTVVQYTSYRVNNETSFENLRAVAIGFVYLHNESQAQGDCFYRPQGNETSNLVVQCETTTDIPSLTTNCSEADFCFAISAVKLYSLKPFETITISKMILLRNDHDIAINAHLQASDPFMITKLRTLGVTSLNSITVEPGNALEVYIDCNLSEMNALGTKELLKVNEGSLKARKKPYELSYTHVRDLTIGQVGLPEQTMQLCLTVTFPILRLSTTKLDFGPVVFHETKRIAFEIENMSVEPLEYWLSFKEDTDCFALDKTRGLLPPWPQPAIYIGESLGIRFTPKDPGDYSVVVLVKTIVPDAHQEIQVAGHGTFNQKFCLRGF